MSFRSFRKFAAAAAVCCAAVPLQNSAAGVTSDGSILLRGVYCPIVTLVDNRNASTLQIIVDDADYACVKKAAEMFCSDLNAVSGREDAAVLGSKIEPGRMKNDIVIAGTLGHSPLIDKLVAEYGIDVSGIKGKWEHTLYTAKGKRNDSRTKSIDANDALIIIGSDRRATAFGLMKLSEDCGMSPWNWWADVPPRHADTLWFAGPYNNGTDFGQFIDAPKVKYRGIFINDEDWALHEWAKNNFEKDGFKRIGPKTNEKIFELLLRLRMNYFWPAMHDVSVEFGAVPENPILADKYGIVMGASHCEPMLRNNCHWKKEDGAWNYTTNQAKIDSYWKESVDQRGDKEAVWTLGIRGIHDSAMQGANTMDEKKALVSKAITNQRAMLDAGVSKEWGPIAQCFVPYKEVLSIYDAGLEVPDDVTLVWVDDNYGYIRRLSNPEEQKRSGGSGVYYHISYYGGPHSYCELNTTPPALMQLELRKAWDNNARDLWVLNVGDLKLMEVGVDYFARLAWDPTRTNKALSLRDGKIPEAPLDKKSGKYYVEIDQLDQGAFLADFVGRNFSKDTSDSYRTEKADAVWTLMDYFQLGAFRKPEEMSQAWVLDLRDDQIEPLKKQYETLIAEAKNAERQMETPELADAWFEIAGYQAQYLGNAGLIFLACREAAKQNKDLREAAEPYIQSIDANRERFGKLHDGKWAGFLPDTVRNRTTNNEWWTHMQWPWNDRRGPHWGNTDHKKGWSDDLGMQFTVKDSHNDGSFANPKPHWAKFRGMAPAGIDWKVGGNETALPPIPSWTLAPASPDINFDEKDENAPGLEFAFETDKSEANALIDFIPSYALYPGRQTRVSVWLNGEYLQTVAVPNSDSLKEENGPRSTLILDNFARVVVPLKGLKKGRNVFTIRAVDPGVSIRAVYLPKK